MNGGYSMESKRMAIDDLEFHVVVAGEGTAVVLLHGWPHTSYLWHRIAPPLARNRLVVAPDLRGLGASERTNSGRDAATLAADVIRLLDALDVDEAAVVAIDAAVPPAFLAALQHPDRVSRLILMEGLLPGVANDLGPPWWFGFHSVPGLAETVLLGHEADYLDWFLTGPSIRRDIGADARANFIAAYTGRDALSAGFDLYRESAVSAAQIHDALTTTRLTVPTLAISGGIVGDAIHSQLVPFADNLTHTAVPDCGHIIPLEQPDALASAITSFLAS
ncbi:pimeloyl-ACP methyl ester carboxylesterase [Kribbella aluminosa]|uniref:Pimeloyl-ACP methyl ester carboxylesterase n=1 Tax=Kribbella aluminosa TaxID=416017 RepID=A0ABS4UJT8_9ACTN|nr:alpha/beta hydrolase [Kribbella aluminosa]MBP2351883.1 pimeloyl-ACP methyl ester carboxylesterase [Kribbella aluminosa]